MENFPLVQIDTHTFVTAIKNTAKRMTDLMFEQINSNIKSTCAAVIEDYTEASEYLSDTPDSPESVAKLHEYVRTEFWKLFKILKEKLQGPVGAKTQLFFLFRFGFVPGAETVMLFRTAFHWSTNIYRYVDECKIRLKQIRHNFETEIEGRVKQLKTRVSQTVARVAKLHRFGKFERLVSYFVLKVYMRLVGLVAS